jgi:hypothetical protein
MSNEAEVVVVAQTIAALHSDIDVEEVQEDWIEYDQASYRERAYEFIALHDALTQHRATYSTAAVERVAKVLVEQGARGVPWEDASVDDRAECMGFARVLLDAALEAAK